MDFKKQCIKGRSSGRSPGDISVAHPGRAGGREEKRVSGGRSLEK